MLYPRQAPRSFTLVSALAWTSCHGPSIWRDWHLRLCPALSETGTERRGGGSHRSVPLRPMGQVGLHCLRKVDMGRWWTQVVEGPISPQEASLLLPRLLLKLALWPCFSHFPGVMLSCVLWTFQIEATSHNNLIDKNNCHLFEVIKFPFRSTWFHNRQVSFIFALQLMLSLSSISFSPLLPTQLTLSWDFPPPLLCSHLHPSRCCSRAGSRGKRNVVPQDPSSGSALGGHGWSDVAGSFKMEMNMFPKLSQAPGTHVTTCSGRLYFPFAV